MSLGSGDTWDESNPTNATLAVQIDDYDRDLRVGVRSRMAHEHEWPSSQSATNQGGQHKFITLQNQATKPTVSGTQLAAVYTKTVGAGLQELFWENEAGTELQLSNRSSLKMPSASVFSYTSTSTSGVITVSSTFPRDGSLPQISEGMSVFSLTVTPSNTASKVMLKANFPFCGSGQRLSGAFFRATTADAIVANLGYGSVNEESNLPIFYVDSPATTGAISYSVRVGDGGQSTKLNAGDNGTGPFGNGQICFFEAAEIGG